MESADVNLQNIEPIHLPDDFFKTLGEVIEYIDEGNFITDAEDEEFDENIFERDLQMEAVIQNRIKQVAESVKFILHHIHERVFFKRDIVYSELFPFIENLRLKFRLFQIPLFEFRVDFTCPYTILRDTFLAPPLDPTPLTQTTIFKWITNPSSLSPVSLSGDRVYPDDPIKQANLVTANGFLILAMVSESEYSCKFCLAKAKIFLGGEVYEELLNQLVSNIFETKPKNKKARV